MLGFDFGDHYGDFFGPSLEYGPNWIGTLIADIYISISMGTFGHRKYKSRGEDGNK